MLKQLYFNWILNCEIFWERILLMMAEKQLNNHFASPTIIKYTCGYANNVDVQSCGHNYNCAWAWSCLSTIRFGARMCLGTVMYGHNRMRALSCGHSRVDTIMCNCKRCPFYYAFRIYKSQVFFFKWTSAISLKSEQSEGINQEIRTIYKFSDMLLFSPIKLMHNLVDTITTAHRHKHGGALSFAHLLFLYVLLKVELIFSRSVLLLRNVNHISEYFHGPTRDCGQCLSR